MTEIHTNPYSDSDDMVLEEERLQEPNLYQVFLHNDNYTSMDFVVMILTTIFHKSSDQSQSIMMAVHKRGFGIAGIYPLEIAETKIQQAENLAREAEFPLRLTLQEVEA